MLQCFGLNVMDFTPNLLLKSYNLHGNKTLQLLLVLLLKTRTVWLARKKTQDPADKKPGDSENVRCQRICIHRGSSQRSEVNYFNQVSGEVWDSTSHIWIHAKLIHIIINLWRQKAALNQSGIPCCFSYRNSLQYLSDPLFWSTLSVRAGKLNFSRQMMLTIRWVSETRSTNTRHEGAFSWEAVTNELAYLSDATGFHDNDVV